MNVVGKRYDSDAVQVKSSARSHRTKIKQNLDRISVISYHVLYLLLPKAPKVLLATRDNALIIQEEDSGYINWRAWERRRWGDSRLDALDYHRAILRFVHWDIENESARKLAEVAIKGFKQYCTDAYGEHSEVEDSYELFATILEGGLLSWRQKNGEGKNGEPQVPQVQEEGMPLLEDAQPGEEAQLLEEAEEKEEVRTEERKGVRKEAAAWDRKDIARITKWIFKAIRKKAGKESYHAEIESTIAYLNEKQEKLKPDLKAELAEASSRFNTRRGKEPQNLDPISLVAYFALYLVLEPAPRTLFATHEHKIVIQEPNPGIFLDGRAMERSGWNDSRFDAQSDFKKAIKRFIQIYMNIPEARALAREAIKGLKKYNQDAYGPESDVKDSYELCTMLLQIALTDYEEENARIGQPAEAQPRKRSSSGPTPIEQTREKIRSGWGPEDIESIAETLLAALYKQKEGKDFSAERASAVAYLHQKQEEQKIVLQEELDLLTGKLTPRTKSG